MRKLVLVACFLAVSACKKSGPDGAGSTAGSGSGSAVASGSGLATTRGCDLAGNYRIRFPSNGAQGWWLRFTVAGTPPAASVVEDQEMLHLKVGPIATVADPAACTLQLTASNDQVGDLTIDLGVDPTTKVVSGALTRTKNKSDGDGPGTVTGAVDHGEPIAAADACFAPAIYELSFVDPKAKWKNSDPDDDRSCKDPMVLPVGIRVEPLGPDIAIDFVQLEGEGQAVKTDDTFGDETVTRAGPCEVKVTMQNDYITFDGTLTFAADGTITGIAANAKNQIVEDGEAGENIWDCVVTGLAITGKKLKAL